MMDINEHQEVCSISFFNKTSGSGISVNEQLAEELHKLVIKKCNRRKVYARFKDNIWVTDLAKMGSLSSKNKKFKYSNMCHKCFH